MIVIVKNKDSRTNDIDVRRIVIMKKSIASQERNSAFNA